MTSKLEFVVACGAVFNCDHNVVLEALAKPVKKHDFHARTKLAIRRLATKSTGASLAEWKKTVTDWAPRHAALARLTVGCRPQVLPLP